MASGNQLILEFENSNGEPIVFRFNYAKQSASLANINALMQAIIDNGSIFKDVPVTAKSAKTIFTTENNYNLS
ncbi:MAG: DUF2922 family protein [Synergistaceae bacterium]|nr:DUF2922 family protein [Synergistaceae bacterium]